MLPVLDEDEVADADGFAARTKIDKRLFFMIL